MTYEHIGEALLQALECERASISGDRFALTLKNGSQIVNTMAMIGMVMRPDHRVDMINSIVEKLVAQIRRCIDQYPGRWAFHKDRDTTPAVFRFIRVAIAPVVADPRHAGRSPASQYREFQGHIQGRALEKS